MNTIINIKQKESALEYLKVIKENDYVPFDIRITNSHITELNKVIGRKVFRKDALYISSRTLWEIMQPIGGKGKHNYHGLTPLDICNALAAIKKPNEIIASHSGRYLIITLALYMDSVPIAIVIEPNGSLKGAKNSNVIRIVTIYPYSQK